MRKATIFASVLSAGTLIAFAISLTFAGASADVTVTSSPNEAAVSDLFRRLAVGEKPGKGDAGTVRFILDSTEGLAKAKRCGFTSTDVRLTKDGEWHEADLWGKTRYGSASEKRSAALKYSRHLGFCYLTVAKGKGVSEPRMAFQGAVARAGYALSKMSGTTIELRKNGKVAGVYRWSAKWDR